MKIEQPDSCFKKKKKASNAFSVLMMGLEGNTSSSLIAADRRKTQK